jgi:SAM-dependent methyltransferase
MNEGTSQESCIKAVIGSRMLSSPEEPAASSTLSVSLERKGSATPCPFCGSQTAFFKATRFNSNEISICSVCGLGYDQRVRSMNYEKETSLPFDDDLLAKYRGYARRITHILNRQIEQHVLSSLPSDGTDVLEIGSGYGFMSDYLTEKLNIRNYYNFEMNLDLSRRLSSNGKVVIHALNDIGRVDLIFMSHVLEHIRNAKGYLQYLFDNKLKPGGSIVLLQTDHRGFIPKYLASVWYGWQLQEHYYHFTPAVFEQYCNSVGTYRIVFTEKYYLDQDIDISLHGIVSLFLRMINMIIPKSKYDAFIVCMKRTIRS